MKGQGASERNKQAHGSRVQYLAKYERQRRNRTVYVCVWRESGWWSYFYSGQTTTVIEV